MKNLFKIQLLISVFLIFNTFMLSGQEIYDKYFTQERLRLDMVFAGDASSQKIFLESMHKESYWSGSGKNLIDPFQYGEYHYKVVDMNGNTLFSKGFNSLFQEWRTTAEAKECAKAFPASYWIPFPKERVKVVFSERVKESGEFREIASFPVDPADKLISCESENYFKVDTVLYNGPSSGKVDLVFIADGYTADEMDKFRRDVQRFKDYLFILEPYRSRIGDFNIWAVESVSKESGPDIPQNGIWRNTALSSNFYTFRIDRYLTAPNQSIVAKAASNAQCDALYVIVNTDKYGGGGIFNFYGLSMSDHKFSAEVFVHEFGHSFAGLGDEYYSSEVAYEEFYNLKTEPWEPNITTNVNFESKWKDMIDPKTPVPTPNDVAYKDVVGLFEGGGYMSKGIFRPHLDCRMKTNTAGGFCPVCVRAINKMIDYYTK